MPSLFRTVYRSRATGAADTDILTLAEILGASRRNNPAVDITGMLLAHDGWFLQALEGQRPHLDTRMKAIADDPRHSDIEILSFDPIQSRAFGAWSMGQATLTPALSQRLASHPLGEIDGAVAFWLLDCCAHA